MHCLSYCINLCLQVVGRQVYPVRYPLELVREKPAHLVFTKTFIFESMQSQLSHSSPSPSLKPLCPTRWMVRTGATNKKHDAGERLTFTTTYSPHLPTYRLRRLLTKHWHLIEKSPLLSRLFPNRPTVAFRTHKSIRKQLTRARLEDSNITHKIDRAQPPL